MSTVARTVSALPRDGAESSNGIRVHVSAAMENERKEPTIKSSAPKTNSIQSPSELPQKGRKRASPFRIKVGCLVALRHRDGGNNITVVSPLGKTDNLSNLRSVEHFADAWADPVPGRDEGLALIGKRVRCFFPKSVLENQSKRATTRILEGEIVAIVDYESNWSIQQKRRRNREPCHFTVELLVDASALASLPFLDRVDEKVDYTNLRPSEKKRQQYEDKIRGKGKITVQVILADHSRIVFSKGGSQKIELVAKWVIRKRIALQMNGAGWYDQVFGEGTTPAANVILKEKNAIAASDIANGGQCHAGSVESKPQDSDSRAVQQADSSLEPPKKRPKTKKISNEAAKSRYIGDGNDPPAQQESNWRWWAGRAHDMELSIGNAKRLGLLEQISNGLVGEVLSLTLEPPQSSTLATVTLRKMILPEHTVNGRFGDGGPFQVYDDSDMIVDSVVDDDKASSNNFVTFRVPVEELVIICRAITRASQSHSANSAVLLAYSVQRDEFNSISKTVKPLPSGDLDRNLKLCHRCKIALPATAVASCSAKCGALRRGQAEGASPPRLWCNKCVQICRNPDGDQILPCCSETCTCNECRLLAGSNLQLRLRDDVLAALSRCIGTAKNPRSLLAVAHRAIEGIEPTDFNLPKAFVEQTLLSQSSWKPITRIQKLRSQRRDKKPTDKKASDGKTVENNSKQKIRSKRKDEEQSTIQQGEFANVSSNNEQSLCSRFVPFDPTSKSLSSSYKTVAEDGNGISNECADMPRNRRQLQLPSAKPEKEDKTNNNRAARANQRRIMKDVVAFGATSLGLDALAGREQKLRFDRSGIHAWGVFADEAIAAGDMIVEYRGELIGNAVAEKREKEYEAAKIGSDYMFRVDSHVVCDATKQGNVARFINASCDPNCYTKTITVDGTKRIVIYAKRDIRAGEELCYDYKFPLEYDETKRIPCFCGTKECRGFMNWNKRYVALPSQNVAGRGDLRKGSLKHTEE